MANPTTNYAFAMPTNTDLVKDLPADFEIFGQAVDTQMKANADAAIAKTIVDAKGDIIVATAADTVTRLAVGGTNDHVLTVDSSTATGLKWAAPVAGKILQVVSATYSTEVSTSTTATWTDSGLTASITPSSTASKIAVFITEPYKSTNNSDEYLFAGWRILRGATAVYTPHASGNSESTRSYVNIVTLSYVDSPSTTSSTTYKLQGLLLNIGSSTGRALQMQPNSSSASIILMEIGA